MSRLQLPKLQIQFQSNDRFGSILLKNSMLKRSFFTDKFLSRVLAR
jgi:hypothetical protein